MHVYEIDWQAMQSAWACLDTAVRLGLGAAALACTGEGLTRNIVRVVQFLAARYQAVRGWLARPSRAAVTAAKVDHLEDCLTTLLASLGEQKPTGAVRTAQAR